MKTTRQHRFSSILRRAALAVTLAAASSMASAGMIHVTVDTSNFGAASGYLDLQLSTGNDPLTTVLVSNILGFTPGAFDDAFGVTPLAGGYLFRNDTVNSVLLGAAFGGLLSFDLSFSSAIDPLGEHESHFVLAAYDELFALLGNYDPQSGMLADFSWTPAATAGADGHIGFSIADTAVTFVPEPSAALLSGIGLAAFALAMRRGNRPPMRAAGPAALA